MYLCHHSTSVQFSNIHKYSYICYVFCLRNYFRNSIKINFWRMLASSVRLVNRVWAGWLQQIFFPSQILDQIAWRDCLITSFPVGVERCGLDMNLAVLLCVVLRLRIVNKQCMYTHTHTHTHTHTRIIFLTTSHVHARSMRRIHDCACALRCYWILFLAHRYDVSMIYFPHITSTRGADKSLARPGRKQANVSVRMAWISFGALPCTKKKLMSACVSILLKLCTSLTCFQACFLPGRAKDL